MHAQIPGQTEKSYTVTFLAGNKVLRPAVGITPLGYKKIFSHGQIFVVPDEKAASKVVLAFELAARRALCLCLQRLLDASEKSLTNKRNVVPVPGIPGGTEIADIERVVQRGKRKAVPAAGPQTFGFQDFQYFPE